MAMGSSGVVLSVVVPTYNEGENVGVLIEEVDRALRACNVPYEVIIVDDNSPDGTADYAEELSRTYPVRVVRRPSKMGLSSAVLDGFKVSRGRFMAVLDADLQHPPELLPKMLEELMYSGCDVVVASRYAEGGSVGRWPFLRRLVSKGAVLIARTLLPNVRGVKDPVSGYFMLKREVVDSVINELSPRGFKILLEVLVKSGARRVREIPYAFSIRHRGRSKLGFREVMNYLLHVLKLAFNP